MTHGINCLVRQYDSGDLFHIEPRQDESSFARRVTCKLCGQVVFDCERDSRDNIDLVFHGLKAHYQIQHQITLGVSPCTDPNCLERGS